MESTVNRIICGTCMFWNGHRELLPSKEKVVIFDDTGICECPISSKSGEIRRKDLRCKEYLKWIENL